MSKRSPPPSFIVIAAVLILLPSLAVLQYRWLGQITDAERGRMNALLQSGASQFAQTFDGEMSRAYSIFQRREAADISTLSGEYAQRWSRWQTSASHPQLVRAVLLVEMNEQGAVRLMRVNPTARSLDAIEWPPELTALRERVTQPPFDVIWEDIPALVIPPEDSLLSTREVDSSSRPHLIAAIVLLDLNYISDVFMPALMSRYFPAENGLSYNLAVLADATSRRPVFESQRDSLSNLPKGGIEMGLFDLRLETMIREDGLRDVKDATANPSPVVVRIIKRNPGGVQSGGELRGRWRLLVNYEPGSLEGRIASSRGRNLAISFGTLILLALSITMLVVSSARATRLAHDQMRFVAGVTHELRTPLAVICSAAENLADGIVNEPAKVQEYGRLIRDDGRRLARMVEQVLASAQSGQQPAYEFGDTDIAELCSAAMIDFSDEIAKADLEIDTDIQPNLPPIMADAPAMKRALQNLISNAIKYDTGQRWIGIRARCSRVTPDQDELQVIVADRGRGISSSELPHIFEPFYRGPDTAVAQIQGSGLGLSLVQQTVAAHGGRVTVESTPGEGSSFTIHLPVAHSRDRTENA